MSPIPCPHCGTTIRQTRADGRCGGCGKLLPEQLRASPEPSGSAAANVGSREARLPTAAAKAPQEPVVMRWLTGVGHRERGEYDQAIAVQSELIRLQPEWPLSYVERGFTYLVMGNDDRA